MDKNTRKLIQKLAKQPELRSDRDGKEIAAAHAVLDVLGVKAHRPFNEREKSGLLTAWMGTTTAMTLAERIRALADDQ